MLVADSLRTDSYPRSLSDDSWHGNGANVVHKLRDSARLLSGGSDLLGGHHGLWARLLHGTQLLLRGRLHHLLHDHCSRLWLLNLDLLSHDLLNLLNWRCGDLLVKTYGPRPQQATDRPRSG